MTRERATLEELEIFAERLKGPLGVALREAGAILHRRMRERGLAWADLDDRQVGDLFMSAFIEAAPSAYPQLDRSVVEDAVRAMAENIFMELAATADGGDAIN